MEMQGNRFEKLDGSAASIPFAVAFFAALARLMPDPMFCVIVCGLDWLDPLELELELDGQDDPGANSKAEAEVTAGDDNKAAATTTTTTQGDVLCEVLSILRRTKLRVLLATRGGSDLEFLRLRRAMPDLHLQILIEPSSSRK